jgi:hypothetical protein
VANIDHDYMLCSLSASTVSRIGAVRRLLALSIVAVLALPAGATAYPKDRTWATINVCDTAGKSNAIGVRAGMPGSAKADRMYMQFTLQYYSRAERRYLSLSPPSTWVDAGSANFRFAQRGFDFLKIADPAAGVRFKYRALVRFEWRERRKVAGRQREVVVRRAKRVTRGGLKGVPGGKPRGRSDAACVVEGPDPVASLSATS